MKETLLLTIALFMLSAPDPETTLERELPMHALLPLVTQDVTPSTEAAEPAPVEQVVATVPAPALEPISVRGSLSAGWTFLQKTESTETMVAQADEIPISNVYRAGTAASLN